MSNYTEKETKAIVAEYLEDPTLENVTRIARKYRKLRKSLISKLSKEGVYKRQVYVTKTGDIPRTKLEIIGNIQEALNLQLQGLEKAPKPILIRLETSVLQLQNDFELLLEEYSMQNELITTQKQLIKTIKQR